MTEPTIWERQHLPTLRAAVDLINADRTFEGVFVRDIAERASLEQLDTFAALRQFEGDGWVEMRKYGGGVARARVVRVSQEAQRAAGAWPSSETVADKLLAALTDVAEHGTDEVTRSRARKALEGLGGLSRDLLVSVAGAATGAAMQ